MQFKRYVQEILKTEIDKAFKQQDYILETSFCQKICDQYNLDISIIRLTLREICSEMPLIRRRLSNQLKTFYKLKEIKGCPIIYISNKE